MAISVTYAPSTNILSVTGGTSAAPASFASLYSADLAGTYTLQSRTGIAATDGAGVNFTYPLRPADSVVLGGNSNNFSVTVSAWSGLTGATVKITGTDLSGAAQTENIAVTGNGTYYAANRYKTATSSQVTAFTGTGSFAYSVVQARWGVVWSSGDWYRLDCQLIVGDDSTTTCLTDTAKEIYISNIQAEVATGARVIDVKKAATLTLGNLVSGTTTANGCMIYSDTYIGTYYYYILIGASSSNSSAAINLYSCSLQTNSGLGYLAADGNLTVYNCTLHNIRGLYQAYNNVSLNMSNIYFVSSPAITGVAFNSIQANVSGISLGGYDTGWRSASAYTLSNCTFSTMTTADIDFRSGANGALVIDCAFAAADPVIEWETAFYNAAGYVGLKNTYGLNVKDGGSNNLQGVQCLMTDNTGATAISGATDASGNLPATAVLQAKYVTTDPTNNVYTSTKTSYNPFTLKIRKYGYVFQTLAKTVAAKTSDNASLATNTYVALSEAAAGALTGISINAGTTTITVSSNHSWQDVYDYSQWWAEQSANIGSPEPITTMDGNNYALAAGWNLTISGATVTGAGKTVTTTGTYTQTSGGYFTGTVTASNGTTTQLQLTGLSGHTVYLADGSGTQQDFQATYTGTYAFYLPITATGTWTWVVKKPGYKGATGSFGAAAGGIVAVQPVTPQDFQPSGAAMYQGTSDANCTVSFTGTTEADIVIGNATVAAQACYDTVERTLVTLVGMQWLAGSKSDTSIALLFSGNWLFMTSGWRLMALNTSCPNAAVGAFVVSTDGTPVDGTNGPVAFLSSAQLTQAQVTAAVLPYLVALR